MAIATTVNQEIFIQDFFCINFVFVKWYLIVLEVSVKMHFQFSNLIFFDSNENYMTVKIY